MTDDPVQELRVLAGILQKASATALDGDNIVAVERAVLSQALPAFNHTLSALADKLLAPGGQPDRDLFDLFNAYTNSVLAIGSLAFRSHSAKKQLNSQMAAAIRSRREYRRREDGRLSPAELATFIEELLTGEEICSRGAPKKFLHRINQELKKSGKQPVSASTAEKAIRTAKKRQLISDD